MPCKIDIYTLLWIPLNHPNFQNLQIMSEMGSTSTHNLAMCYCSGTCFGTGVVLTLQCVGGAEQWKLWELICFYFLLWDSPERIKKRQTLILIQNGPLLLSFCLLLKELFLGAVINRSGDFKLPPQIYITSLE